MVGADESELERKVTQHKTAAKKTFDGKGRRLDDPDDPVAPPPAFAGGSLPGAGASVAVNEETLTILLDMGFGRSVSIKALKASRNDLDAAVTWFVLSFLLIDS